MNFRWLCARWTFPRGQRHRTPWDCTSIYPPQYRTQWLASYDYSPYSYNPENLTDVSDPAKHINIMVVQGNVINTAPVDGKGYNVTIGLSGKRTFNKSYNHEEHV